MPKNEFIQRPRILIPDELSIEEAERLWETYDEPVIFYTPQMMRAFEWCTPSLIYGLKRSGAIPKDHGISYRLSPKERGRALAHMTQTRLASKFASVCPGIVQRGRVDLGTVNSKLHELMVIDKIGRRLLKIPDTGYDPEFLPSHVYNCEGDEEPWTEDDLRYLMIHIKCTSSDMVRRMPSYVGDFKTKRRDNVTTDRDRFGYVDTLRDAIRDDLIAVMPHGSSVLEDDPDQYNDVDYIVVVRDGSLDHWCREFNGKNPSQNGKPVELNLFEEGEIQEFLAYGGDTRAFESFIPLAYGELDVPVIPDNQRRYRLVTQMVLRGRQIAGVTNLAVSNPKLMVEKPHLSHFVAKTPRFLLREMLTLEDGDGDYRPLKKAVLDEQLADIFGYSPLPIEECRGPADHRKNMIHAYATSAQIIGRIMGHPVLGARPDFSFMEGVPPVPGYGEQ